MWKYLLVGFVVLVGFIQIIPYEFEETLDTPIEEEIVTPIEVKEILVRSCYDCHSSSAEMPWYSDIAPFSWSIKSHIEEGRDIVNFSIFSSYDKAKQKELYEKIDESVTIRMPLPSYLWFHDEARMSEEDRKLIKEWAKSELDED
ncbi:MAG: heme-binding domain-containing protein [Epsilonproteobacteria bacterium]|nr:heme-binding domain-containing protein [Campylobacterota bacterium]MBD3839006.1 heme-binding domain-containing protein [Campylobacterota bacterium]